LGEESSLKRTQKWIKWTEHISPVKRARSRQDSAFCWVLWVFSGNHRTWRCTPCLLIVVFGLVLSS